MKLKRYVCLVLALALMSFGMSGCMFSTKDGWEQRIAKAKTLLNQKYNQNFEVLKYGKSWGTLSDNYFTVLCVPEDNPNAIFEAEISKENDFMQDEYLSKLVCLQIEDKLSTASTLSNNDFSVWVEAGTTYIESSNTQITIDEYQKLIPNNKYLFDIIVSKNYSNKTDLTRLVNDINKSLNGLGIDGYVYFCLNASSDEIKLFDENKVTEAKSNSAVDEILDRDNSINLSVENGEIILTDEFSNL